MAESGKIADEEVVNSKDQEGGDLQEDATFPSHYEHQNHARFTEERERIYSELESTTTFRGKQEEGGSELESTTTFIQPVADTSLPHKSKTTEASLRTADPSPADGYTRMFPRRRLRGEQEEGASESKSTTPSMKPAVDTSLPNSTTHNSKRRKVKIRHWFRPKQEKGGSESESTTTSMQPVVDASIEPC